MEVVKWLIGKAGVIEAHFVNALKIFTKRNRFQTENPNSFCVNTAVIECWVCNQLKVSESREITWDRRKSWRRLALGWLLPQHCQPGAWGHKPQTAERPESVSAPWHYPVSEFWWLLQIVSRFNDFKCSLEEWSRYTVTTLFIKLIAIFFSNDTNSPKMHSNKKCLLFSL